MRKTTRHLNDEHMRLYEWCGAGDGTGCAIPPRSKRTHPWHASYSVLAVMTSVLILNGCDKKDPVEQAGEPVVQEMKKEAGPLNEDNTPRPAAAGEAGGVESPAPVQQAPEPAPEGAAKP